MTSRHTLGVVIAVALGALLLACERPEESLPGRPCDEAEDCDDDFACVRVPGREDAVCVPAPERETPVGCDGKSDGESCADGDSCTEGDACVGGACVGTPKACGSGETCVGGTCLEGPGSCVEQPTGVAVDTGTAAGPRLAYNPVDDEVGILFDAPVLDRREVFFVRVGPDGTPRSGLVQLTDGTPQQDTPAISTTARDIAFAREVNRYGILVEDNFLSGLQFTAVTADGAVAVGLEGIAASTNLFGILARPARMDWTGARFVATWIDFGNTENVFDVFVDSVDADGGGDTLFDQPATDGTDADELDIAANTARNEVAVAFTNSSPEGPAGVFLLRADPGGVALRVVTVQAGGSPAGPAIAFIDLGYLIVWQEGSGPTSRIVGAVVDDTGEIVTGPLALTDETEGARVPDVAGTGSGAVLAYLAAVDGAVEVRARSLSATLVVGAPRVIRAGMSSAFAPAAASMGNGGAALSWGPTATPDDDGNVEVARVCPE